MTWKLGVDLHEKDNILDGLTFDDVITMLRCNVDFDKPGWYMDAQQNIQDLTKQHINNFYMLLNENIDEIIQRSKQNDNI